MVWIMMTNDNDEADGDSMIAGIMMTMNIIELLYDFLAIVFM